MLRDMEEHKLTRCADVKAENFPPEPPTVENLPEGYMDGFSRDSTGFGGGGNFQGPLVGDRDFYFMGQDDFGGAGFHDFPPGRVIFPGRGTENRREGVREGRGGGEREEEEAAVEVRL